MKNLFFILRNNCFPTRLIEINGEISSTKYAKKIFGLYIDLEEKNINFF